MKNSLKARLSLSYVMVAFVSVLVISIVTNVFMEKQFRVYTIKNQESKNADVAKLIGQQYAEDGKWNTKAIENIGVNAIAQGMIIKVSDNSENIIWDASLHNNGMCKEILDHIEKNMSKVYPSWDGKYQIKLYPVFSNKIQVGIVEVGYYGPFYYNDNDLAFIDKLNKALIIIGILSLIFALILGVVMAKHLSDPITRTIKAAENIEKGYYNNRITEKSDIEEITLLIHTINNLADTLEKQEELRKRMSADVAHELRTPLATLQSHMEAMIDGIWNPDNKRLTSCYEEIMRISRLVGELEKLAKYDSETYKLNKIKYNITKQMEEIIYNFQINFNNKDVKIKFSGSNEEITADKDKISQVIINLISNALKYTDTKGTVEIKLEKKNDFIQIRVKDTGKGISKNDLPFIFERFYRADKSRNRLTGGFGIGLTISKAIVDSHNGKIEVFSQMNKGTEFIVSIPINILSSSQISNK
ncbi:MAG: ATP-binding protein [Bacillota bacterium]|nr:ATP-binding protein [Bacillota bacterium]